MIKETFAREELIFWFPTDILDEKLISLILPTWVIGKRNIQHSSYLGRELNHILPSKITGEGCHSHVKAIREFSDTGRPL